MRNRTFQLRMAGIPILYRDQHSAELVANLRFLIWLKSAGVRHRPQGTGQVLKVAPFG